MSHFDYDAIVIGSGFGGSVSAMRLSEKGYKVAVIEAGRRFRAEDYPKTNWDVKNYVYSPRLGLNGIMRYTLLPDLLVLGGAGVGGGSLVYANTLYVPPDNFFKHHTWAHLNDWKHALEGHYKTASHMLGVTDNQFIGPGDRTLKEVAEDMGMGHTYRKTRVGVFFGKPGETVPDPYFGGKGPDRTGCNFCGACMVGCRYGAKNTLDKNYLYFAEQNGTEIIPERTVTGIRALTEGYEVSMRPSSAVKSKGTIKLKARKVVVSAGVLGTMKILMNSKMGGGLPNISERLGRRVRSNSESILAVTAKGDQDDYSKGIAITSSIHPDNNTHIEVVRYNRGSDVNSLLSAYLTDKKEGTPRALSFLANLGKNPGDFFRALYPLRWAERTTILLVMQTLDNSMKLTPKRLPGGGLALGTSPDEGPPNPTYIPVANEVARRFAKRINGVPQSSLNEVLLDAPVTAHILGGATIGDGPEEGVIAPNGEVFGHPGLYVCDGSVMPANLGVNPSLTITALAEYMMAQMPEA